MGSCKAIPLFLLFLLLFAGCASPEAAAEEPFPEQNVTEPAAEPPAQPTETQETPLEEENAQPPPEEATPEPGEQMQTPNQGLVDSVLASYNENDSSTFSNVNLLLETTPADMLPLLESNNSYAQWTGLYILSNIAYNATPEEQEEIKEALSPFLEGDRPSFTLMAAVALLTMGDKEGIPALIDLLGSDELFFLSEPPTLVCTDANEFLVRYTERDFGYSCAPGQFNMESKYQWEAWWEENSASIQWDASAEKMVVE